MDNEEKILESEHWRVYYRVICVGEETSGAFRSIKSFGYDKYKWFSVQSTTMVPNPTPTEGDKMVILLSNGDSQQLEGIAKSFYQAGVLTVLVTTKIVEMTEAFCDTQTVAPIESMPFIVKALLNYLFSIRVNGVDSDDLSALLYKSGKFKVIQVSSVWKENCIQEMVSKISKKLAYNIGQIERLSLVIYINNTNFQSLKITDLEALKDYVHELPNNIDVIWSIGYDNEMQNDEVRLDALLFGKNLQLLHNSLPKPN